MGKDQHDTQVKAYLGMQPHQEAREKERGEAPSVCLSVRLSIPFVSG